MSSPIALRVPSTHQPPNSPTYKNFDSPDGTWLAGTWHVTHSSLPLWKDKHDVNITYVNLPSGKVQDTTAYTPDGSKKIKSITGVNTPAPNVPAAFDWRGKGWLAIATSHWEILGWGDLAADGAASTEVAQTGTPAKGDAWVVTYFSKTLFTPAGVDIYSRNKKGISESALEQIKEKLAELNDPELKQLVGTLFQIKQENA